MTSVFRLLAFVLLLASASIARAQDRMPPVLPVFEGSIPHDKIAWSADGNSLLFEANNGQGYAYDPATGKLSVLDQSPFTVILTDEQSAFYQASKSAVLKSPYSRHILYSSSLHIFCGDECNGQLIMGGEFCDDPDCDPWGVYQPLEIHGDFTARWNGKGNAAIVRIISAYGSFDNWYRVEFSQGYEANSVFIGVLEAYTDEMFAIADDGQRILYANAIPSSNLRRLMLWEMEAYRSGDYESNTLSVTSTHTEKIKEGNIVGAGFSEGQYDILYVDDGGITGYSSNNGVSTILNAAINSSWVEYGLFSPDNQYVAVLANDNLYVVPTHIET